MLLLVFLSARSKPVKSVIDVLMNRVDLKEDFYNNNPKAERFVKWDQRNHFHAMYTFYFFVII